MKNLITHMLGACLIGMTACTGFDLGTSTNPRPLQPAQLASATEPIFTAEQAAAIIEEFKVTHAKLGEPKYDVRVNPPVGVPVAAPDLAGDPASPPPLPLTPDELSTQQTKREVERLFGRPLRMAGATLVDADLSNASEVSFEVLISARKLGRENGREVPDIQVTAIRFADGSIVGQATVLDLFPNQAEANRRLPQYTIQQLTQATAMAVMRDISATTK